MPAGRILAGRGLDKYGRKMTLSNCYVMPKVEDNIESIFDTAKYMAENLFLWRWCRFNVVQAKAKGC